MVNREGLRGFYGSVLLEPKRRSFLRSVFFSLKVAVLEQMYENVNGTSGGYNIFPISDRAVIVSHKLRQLQGNLFSC